MYPLRVLKPCRQTFLTSKVIDNLPDETDEEYIKKGKKTNIIIADTDYDWDDPEGTYPMYAREHFHAYVICMR
jgi:hypothetical protein